MIRQAIINNDPYLLYAFLTDYKGILFESVLMSQFSELRHTITATLISDPSVYVFTFNMNRYEGYEQFSVGVTYPTDTGVVLKASAASTGADLVNQLDYAYGTDNGFMLHFTYDAIDGTPNLFATVMMTTGSDGNPFIIVTDPGETPTNNDLTHLSAKVFHYTDTNYLALNMCQFNSAMQTEAVPFVGYGNVATISEAKHAFWMPVSNSYGQGFNRMSFQEAECVTNGYWIIDDKPDEEVDA